MEERPRQAQTFAEIQIGGIGNNLNVIQVLQGPPTDRSTQRLIPQSPYRGLRRFEEHDASLFFGRSVMTSQLLSTVRRRTLTLVAGASGSGKSSLLNAGLLPAIRQALTDVRVISLVPDSDPFELLRAAILGAGVRHQQIERYGRPERWDSRTLPALCRELRNAQAPWLILIDQFEQLFTLTTDENRRMAFINGLVELGTVGFTDVKLVVAMRSDCFPRFDAYPQLLKQLEPPFFITSPDPEELRLCIEQPAVCQGVTFDADLVDEILLDVRAQPGALPLLSYALDLLWKKDAPSEQRRVLTRSSYRELGGISGALKQRANAVYERRRANNWGSETEPRSTEQREAMRRLFLRLLDLSKQGDRHYAVSRRVPRSEFPADEQPLIDELCDEKLVITEHSLEPHGEVTVEVVHESLVSNWPRLSEWVGQVHQAVHTIRRMEEDAKAWHIARTTEGEEPDDELWSGIRLQVAIEQRARGDFQRAGGLSSLADDFLRASCDLRRRRALKEQDYREALARVQQLELDAQVEAGRLLLAEMGKPLEAALRLQRALERGSQSALLPYVLKQATRPIDAVQRILLGHTDSVLCAAFSPDGRHVVSASADASVILWSVHTGEKLLTLSGHQRSVNSVAFHPHGHQIASGASDHTICIWDLASAQRSLVLEGHKRPVLSVGFSSDGQRIVSASADHTIRIWNVLQGREVSILRGHVDIVSNACFNANGRRIASASCDKTALVWDTDSGQPLLSLRGHQDMVFTIGFSPDGRRLVTTSADQTLRVWDAYVGTQLLSVSEPETTFRSASFSPDGRRIVTAADDGNVRVWDACDGRLLFSLDGHQDWVNSVEFSTNGRQIVSASSDHSLRVWDARREPQLCVLTGPKDFVRSVRFSRDGRHMVAASDDQGVHIWNAQNGRPVRVLQGHQAPVFSVDISPNGRHIASASEDSTVRIWDLQTAESISLINNVQGSLTGVEFSRNGDFLLSAGEDGAVRLWDAHSWLQICELPHHGAAVHNASFSSDGQLVVSAASDNHVRVWDARSGKPVLIFPVRQGALFSASFSPDNHSIVTASGRTVAVWHAGSGQPLLLLQGHRCAVRFAKFCPDGQRIVSCSSDGSLRVWHARTGRIICTLSGHRGSVVCVDFSPDGSQIVSGSADQTIRTWDASKDTRSAAELALLLVGRVPLKLEGEVIQPARIDPALCQPSLGPANTSLQWMHAESALWASVRALNVGRNIAAQLTLREGRAGLVQSADAILLWMFDLLEDACLAPGPAPISPAMVNRLLVIPDEKRTDAVKELASFAQNELFRPGWALSLAEISLAGAQDRLCSQLQLLRTEAMLSATLVDAELCLDHLFAIELDQYAQHSVELAACLTLAAALKPNEKLYIRWAHYLIESYSALRLGVRIAWNVRGLRHSYELRTESPLRTQALELLTLLEQPKSSETSARLARLFKVP